MQNATKKLIASLVVVLMGVGIAGAANAKNLKLNLYKGDMSVEAVTSTGHSLLQCKNISGPGWKDMHTQVSAGAVVVLRVYKSKGCTGSMRQKTKRVPKDTLTNYWFETRL